MANVANVADSTEIRPFSGSSAGTEADKRIGASINRVLANMDVIEPGKHMAIVGYYDGKQPRLGVFARVGDDWSFGGTLTHPPSGKWEGEVAVRWSL